MNSIRLISAFLGSAVWTSLAVAQPAPDRVSIPLSRLVSGSGSFATYSGLTSPVRRVVRDAVTWSALWDQINRPFLPRPPLPAVNFRRENIVIVASGAQPTGGYAVTIEAIEQDSAGIEVVVREDRPAPGCPVSAATTQPLDLVRLPASDQAVRFRNRAIVIPCASP
jgi:hypothetical protein